MQQVKYSAEFKEEVVRQVIDRGHTVINLAKRLRIGDCLLFTCVKKFKAANEPVAIDDMSKAPALLFLLARKRFRLHSSQGLFWIWIAWSALAFVAFFYNSPSSTALERLALFWLPLQLFVWSCFTDATGRPGTANALWVFVTVAYSEAVYFVWIFFAVHCEYRLLYKFYPLVWLWQ